MGLGFKERSGSTGPTWRNREAKRISESSCGVPNETFNVIEFTSDEANFVHGVLRVRRADEFAVADF